MTTKNLLALSFVCLVSLAFIEACSDVLPNRCILEKDRMCAVAPELCQKTCGGCGCQDVQPLFCLQMLEQESTNFCETLDAAMYCARTCRFCK